MLREDLERAVFRLFDRGLGAEFELDQAGDSFRGVGLDAWVEPRITEVAPMPTSGPGEEQDDLTLTVRVFVRQGAAQGGFRLGLSRVVDRVRELVDASLGAPAVPVETDREGGDPLVVGTLTWGPARERRAFNSTITVRGDAIPNVDVATLTVVARAQGGSCG